MAAVVLRNLMKKFGTHQVIDSLDLVVENGEFVTLLGPSGCGKTTLLRMIAGLESVDAGEILIGGKNCNSVPTRKRKIAMVFQSYALFPHMSVRNNILFGLRIHHADKEQMQCKLESVISLLQLENLETRLPRELSGGQRQRVALARALVLDPEVLLLDEPLSNLDAALRESATVELKRIHRKVRTTVIYVTHNQIEAMTMSERVALIRDGHVEQYDKPLVLYDNPHSVFSAGFIGSPPINLFDGEIIVRDDAAGVQTPLGFLLFDKERVANIAEMNGKKVIAGIRPQHISLAAHHNARRVTDTTLELTAEIVENMGDRSLIIATTVSGAVVRFVMTRDEEIGYDQKVSVFVDGRRIHLFDPETRLNIFTTHGTI